MKGGDGWGKEVMCGCGLAARYFISGRGSCNKYHRCPTYKELTEDLVVSSNHLRAYRWAIDRIDDYFEYCSGSPEDKKKVYQILGNLTDRLKDSSGGL